jgi:hypothetical protein
MRLEKAINPLLDDNDQVIEPIFFLGAELVKFFLVDLILIIFENVLSGWSSSILPICKIVTDTPGQQSQLGK